MRKYLQDYLAVLGDARRGLPWIVLLLLFSALLDVLGLGLIAPLIAAITNMKGAFEGKGLWKFMLGEDGGVNRHSMVMLAVLVILAFAVKGVVAYWVQWSIARFSEMRRRDLMKRLLEAYLAKPYEFHLQRNSSTLINAIISFTAHYASGTLAGSMRLFADSIMALAIMAFLAWTDAIAVTVLVLLLAGVFVVYNGVIKVRMHKVGFETATAGEAVIRSVADSIGPLREVRILGVESAFVDGLYAHAKRLADWSAMSVALQTVPRYLVETAMVSFIVVLGVLSVLNGTHADAFIPTLGVFGVAALRLMPASTSLMSGFNGLRQSRYVLGKLAEDLQSESVRDRSREGPGSAEPRKPFAELRFDNVTYAYPGQREPAVSAMSFTIKAGQAIGLIGKTGSGKSTTADLLLGLLQPQSGAILVDGTDVGEDRAGWMRQLAYIPQAIFLTDASLRENVAFGVPPDEIDDARLQQALSASQLTDVVSRLPAGLDTVVGERGVRLSGGQRQRVALARALYHDRQLIVMDEATASLDQETEREVVRAITTLHGKKTLVIIAHRLSTLEGCDAVIRIEAGKRVQ